MVPPGMPDFFTRDRIVDAGVVPVHGRAWSGRGAIERVEIGVDGGGATPSCPAARRVRLARLECDWAATPGEHELTCRATDSSGAVQPLEPEWNYQGMGNNMVQRRSASPFAEAGARP